MLDTVLLTGSVILYSIATAIIARCIVSHQSEPNATFHVPKAFILGAIATLLHLGFAASYCFHNGNLNFSLSSMSVLISALLCLIYLLGGLALPIRRLGVMVFPLTVLCLVFSQLWNNEPVLQTHISMAASAHIVVSMLAYCLLTIATIQSLLYVYQERQIKNRTNPAMLMALPPIQTMEQLLFRLIWVGFALLTFTLVSGSVFSQQIFGVPFSFKHHTILASLSWLVFAILLFKRIQQGLRGSQATYWVIGGFVLIQLGYFGTKVVSESLAVQ